MLVISPMVNTSQVIYQRRWPNVNPTMGQRLVISEIAEQTLRSKKNDQQNDRYALLPYDLLS